MADWQEIRRLARRARQEVLAESDPALIKRLVPAEQLLELACSRAELMPVGVPPTDPLLAGAHAVLDRETGAIWFNREHNVETMRFNIAHELGHLWLHNEASACSSPEISDEPTPNPVRYGASEVTGYSPAQRREVEANVFAAEFLLPIPLLRAALIKGATSSKIANRVGLSETCVLGQLAESLVSDPNEPQQPQPQAAPEPFDMDRLDSSQREAAELPSGPALITAGPGTGKTRTLVTRTLLLMTRGTPPERILALTFSNRAANEMRERLALSAPDEARRIWIGTFHAFGLETLRKYGAEIGLPPSPALIDRMDAISLLEENLVRLELKEYEYLNNPTFPFGDMLSAISRAKDELVGPDQYAQLATRMRDTARSDEEILEAERALEVARVYRVWEELLRERGLLDFGDLISKTVYLLENYPDIRARVQSEFDQILVDEYQDINRASAVMVRLIAGEGEGLWAVGDLRQSIYRFRGASPANLVSFDSDFPGAKRLSLQVNYRSRAEIVNLFGTAAENMTAVSETDGARLAAHREATKGHILYASASSEETQAEGIANTIRRFQSEGVALREMAILCRTNSQADQLVGALEARDVPVLFLGDLFARPEIRDMLSLLSLACEGNGSGLWRVGQWPDYSIPPEEILQIIRSAEEAEISVIEQIRKSATEPNCVEGLKALANHVGDLLYRGEAYHFLCRYLFGETEYLRRRLQDRSIPAHQSLVAIYQLINLARSFAGRADHDPDMNRHQAFLAHVRRLITTREDTRVRLPDMDGIEAVRLMTLHASKGLEFPVVFVPNLARDKFPGRKPGSQVKVPAGLGSSATPDPDKTDDNDEEQCLFFVALSRARDRIVLSHAGDRSELLDLIEETIGGGRVAREYWKQTSVVPPKPVVRPYLPSVGALPMGAIPVSQVEQYTRCPRQYYYDQILRLNGGTLESAYSAFQGALWQTFRWATDERSAGRVHDTGSALRHFDELWQESNHATHPHAPLLQARAHQILERYWNPANEQGLPEPQTLTAQLANGTIAIKVDNIQRTQSGGLLVERVATGRPTSNGHTAPRLSLIRQAVRQHHPDANELDLQLRYLATDETISVPEKATYEKKRLEKYEAALRGIRTADFAPKPSRDECARCPFLLICPS